MMTITAIWAKISQMLMEGNFGRFKFFQEDLLIRLNPPYLQHFMKSVSYLKRQPAAMLATII